MSEQTDSSEIARAEAVALMCRQADDFVRDFFAGHDEPLPGIGDQLIDAQAWHDEDGPEIYLETQFDVHSEAAARMENRVWPHVQAQPWWQTMTERSDISYAEQTVTQRIRHVIDELANVHATRAFCEAQAHAFDEAGGELITELPDCLEIRFSLDGASDDEVFTLYYDSDDYRDMCQQAADKQYRGDVDPKQALKACAHQYCEEIREEMDEQARQSPSPS